MTCHDGNKTLSLPADSTCSSVTFCSENSREIPSFCIICKKSDSTGSTRDQSTPFLSKTFHVHKCDVLACRSDLSMSRSHDGDVIRWFYWYQWEVCPWWMLLPWICGTSAGDDGRCPSRRTSWWKLDVLCGMQGSSTMHFPFQNSCKYKP